MTPLFNPVPFAPTTLTDSELIGMIDHHYPGLHGPLREMFVRMRRQVERTPDVSGETHNCPHCGSQFVPGGDE